MNQRTRSFSRELLLRKVRRGEMGMERLHLITHLCCQVSTMCHHSTRLWWGEKAMRR